MLNISEMGAIQPCHIPKKNPARCSLVKFPSPGMHAAIVTTIIAARKIKTMLFIFILTPLWKCFAKYYNVSTSMLVARV